MSTREYFIAYVVAFAVVLTSFGTGLLLSFEPVTVGRVTGAAWAWAIGAGTGLWVVPWVKRGFDGEGGA